MAEALRALVSSPKFELIPLSNALDRAASLPPGATVTVTASPSHGIEATFDLAEDVAAMGHEAIPHLSAHMIRDHEHLRALLQRASDTGIRSAFVVGGDAKDRGEYHDGISLLRAMEELGHPFLRDRRALLSRKATRTSPTTCCSRRCSRSSGTPRT